MDFHQAYNFLRKLEVNEPSNAPYFTDHRFFLLQAYFRKHPSSHLQKICQVLADFSPTENNAVEVASTLPSLTFIILHSV